MKKSIFILSLLFISPWVLKAQEKNNVVVDLGLSQVYDGFFSLYNGVVDFGAGYNQKITGGLYTGVSMHFDFLKRKNTTSRTIVYKPKLNLSYNIRVSDKFHILPIVAIGYSFLNISNDEYQFKETQSGINPGCDLKLLWSSYENIDLYLFGRYDYIYLDENEDFTKLEYYRSIHMSSFGIGIKFKPKKRQ